jgi:hypothetical protein
MIQPGTAELNCDRKLITALIAMLGLLLFNHSFAAAAEANHRTISVTINKGETYTINDVNKKVAAPGVKVANNPNALLVRTEVPGKIVLVGADAGSWNLEVTLATGEKVIYAVNVKSDAPPQGSLSPASAPYHHPVNLRRTVPIQVCGAAIVTI